MPQMRLEGFPTGSVDVDFAQGASSGSDTGTNNRAPRSVEGDAYVLKATTHTWEGVSATVGGPDNGFCGTALSPMVHYQCSVISEVDGNKMGVDFDNDAGIDDNEYASTFFAGGTVDIYRITNGEEALIRTSNVVDANVGRTYNLEALNKSISSGYKFRFGQSFMLRETWFGVAAVDAGGQYGTIAWTSFTPATTTDSGTVSNTLGTLATTATSGGALSAPANLAAAGDAGGDRTVVLTWDAVGSAVGYVGFYAWEDPSGHPTFRFIELENDGGAAMQAGDRYVFRRRLLTPSGSMAGTRAGRAQSIYRHIWGTNERSHLFDGSLTGVSGSYVAFGTKPSGFEDQVGDYYLRVALDGTEAAGDIEATRDRWAAPINQTFYHTPRLGETYRMTVMARASRAVTGGLKMAPDVQSGSETTSFNLTTSWQEFTVDVTPAVQRTGINSTSVYVVSDGGAAVNVDLAGLTIRRTSQILGGFSTEMKSRLVADQIIRDHGLIKIGVDGYYVEDLIQPYGGSHKGVSVHSYLTACADAGVTPWLQVEWLLNPTEWAYLVAYLGATTGSGHPAAAARAAHGQTAPWTTVFDRILFEFGNEAWNTFGGFNTTPSGLVDDGDATVYGSGEVMGLICRRAAQAMQASPYWSDRIEFVIGGWSRNSFGPNAASTFKLPVEIGIANYNGGWDEGGDVVTEDDAGYQNVMASAASNAQSAITDQVAQLTATAASLPYFYTLHGTLKVTCYEAGPGYQFSDLTGAQEITQEVVMKSRAAATATIDTALMQAVAGFTRYNFFTLGENDTWSAASESGYQGELYPSYAYLKILHEQIGGTAMPLIGVKVRDDTVTVNDSGGDPFTADNCFVYGLKCLDVAGRWIFVVGNRNRSRRVQPTICTPLGSATSCKVYRNRGDYRHHNRYLPGYRVNTSGAQTTADEFSVSLNSSYSSLTVDVPADLTRIVIDDALGMEADGIQPGNFVIIVLDGVTQGIQTAIPERAVPSAGKGLVVSSYLASPAGGTDIAFGGTGMTVSPVLGVAGAGTLIAPVGTGLTVSPRLGVSAAGGGTGEVDEVAPTLGAQSYANDVITIPTDEGGTVFAMWSDNAVETGLDVVNNYDATGASVSSTYLPMSATTAGARYLHVVIRDAAGNISEPSTARYTVTTVPAGKGLIVSPYLGRSAAGTNAEPTVGTGLIVSPYLGVARKAEPFSFAVTASNLGTVDYEYADSYVLPTPAAGLAVFALISERNGQGYANLTVSGGNGTWTRVAEHDQNLTDPNSRNSMALYRMVTTAADASAGSVTVTGSASGGAYPCMISAVVVTPNGPFAFSDGGNANTADSGTADWNGLTVPSFTVPSGNNYFGLAVAAGRRTTGDPTSATFSNFNDDNLLFSPGGTNEYLHAWGFLTSGQSGGSKTTTLTVTGGTGGVEGAGAIVFLGET